MPSQYVCGALLTSLILLKNFKVRRKRYVCKCMGSFFIAKQGSRRGCLSDTLSLVYSEGAHFPRVAGSLRIVSLIM